MNYYDKKIETMNRDDMRALQSKRLKEEIEYVYERVPFYRAKMDAAGVKPSDINSIDDIVKLPYTTKHDLRENYPFGLFATPMKDIVRIHASSGTTGKLTVVGYTQRDLDDWSICFARSLVMTGCSDEDVLHVSYGYGLFTGGLGAHYGGEKLGCAVVPCSTGNTQRQLMLMKDFGATALCCTPSYALFLAESIEKDENYTIDDFKLKAGIFGAEPWSLEMKNEIEKRLHIKAYDIYGLSEISGPGVAMNCGGEGLHVMEDFFYPEVVSLDKLEPVADGEKGELVFTTLRKQGIPLIRYRTRDITSLNHEVCPICGRTLVRMARVTGRSDDMLIIRGVNVFPSQIESVLIGIDEINGSHYQIIVDRKGNLDSMEIQVEMRAEYFSDEVKKIEAVRTHVEHDMQSALGIAAKITLSSPGSIPLSEGKTVRIVDKRKFD